MIVHGYGSADLSYSLQVDPGQCNSWAIRSHRHDLPPRIDNHGVAETLPQALIVVFAILRRRQNIALGFDSPCPQQGVSMILACGQGERRGHRQNFTPSAPQLLIEAREPQVVADAQTQDTEWG